MLRSKRLTTLLAAVAITGLAGSVAFAATPRAGGWKGTTKVGSSVSFKVSKNRKSIVGFKIKKVKFTCPDGPASAAQRFTTAKVPVKRGKFVFKLSNRSSGG